VTDLIRVLRAFIAHEGATRSYLTSINADPYLVKTVAYELQTIVGDGFMVRLVLIHLDCVFLIIYTIIHPAVSYVLGLAWGQASYGPPLYLFLD
jgi:hypothetical protein